VGGRGGWGGRAGQELRQGFGQINYERFCIECDAYRFLQKCASLLYRNSRSGIRQERIIDVVVDPMIMDRMRE